MTPPTGTSRVPFFVRRRGSRAVKWTRTQKQLTPPWAAELKAFRAEAEELLRNKPRTK